MGLPDPLALVGSSLVIHHAHQWAISEAECIDEDHPCIAEADQDVLLGCSYSNVI
jgi:hypothetical protein